MRFKSCFNNHFAIIAVLIMMPLIACSVGDDTAPATINDLSSDETTRNLSWTAPGDSGNTGRATIYFPRYLDNIQVAEILGVPNLDDVPFAVIQETVQDNFGDATQIPNFMQPEPAGNPETFLTPRIDLTGEMQFFYAILTNDETGDSSRPSNVTEITTPLQSVRYVSGGGDSCLGEAVTGGNFNGDENDQNVSINDIAVGDPCAGRVYIFFGQNNLTDNGSTTIDVTTADVTVIGDASEGFGASLARLPHFRSDSRTEELVIGAPDFDGGRGKIYLIFGDRDFPSVVDLSDPEVDRLEVIGENVGDGFGTVVSDGDDVSDGRGQFLVGAPFFDGDTGRVYLFRGNNLTDNEELLASEENDATITGESSGGFLGSSIALAGRINRNSHDEFVVGAPGIDKAYVIFGRGNLPSIDLAFPTEEVVELEIDGVPSFGTSVSGDGDVDEDGEERPDIIVGAPENNSSTGSVFLFGSEALLDAFENGTPITFETEYTGISAGDRFGQSVSILDGFNPIIELRNRDTAIVLELEENNASVAVGAPGTVPVGTSYVFFGSDTLPAEISASDADITFVGDGGDAEYGQLILDMGDVNGDEISDYAVGGTGFIEIVY